MDILEELNGSTEPNAEAQPSEPQATEPQAEPTPAEPTEPTEPTSEESKSSQPRGPDGKFAKKDEQPMVPLAALHETRDKVRDLEARLAALSQPQQVEAPQVPDIFENPEAYTAHLQNQIAQVTLNDRLNLSEEMARQSAGDETVNAAQEWGKQLLTSNPAFAQAFYSQRNPYGFLVKEYQRHQTMSQLGNADPEEIKQFLEWREAQKAPQAAPQPQAIPTSLAAAQSARGGASTYQPPSLEDLLKG